MKNNNSTYSPVLLAEDDPNDVLLMRRAFEQADLHNRLVVVGDGEEVIGYLEAKTACACPNDEMWPGLLLLDLKMPVKDGWDVLNWLREPGHRQDLPVVVLSSSNSEFDVKRALALGANAYRVKPFEFRGLVQLARELADAWLTPSRAAAPVKWAA